MDLKGAGWEGVTWIHLVRNRILRWNCPLYDYHWLLRTSVIHISKRNKKHELQDGTPGDCCFKYHHVGRIKRGNVGTEFEYLICVKAKQKLRYVFRFYRTCSPHEKPAQPRRGDKTFRINHMPATTYHISYEITRRMFHESSGGFQISLRQNSEKALKHYQRGGLLGAEYFRASSVKRTVNCSRKLHTSIKLQKLSRLWIRGC
jgi:hypothetical protein